MILRSLLLGGLLWSLAPQWHLHPPNDWMMGLCGLIFRCANWSLQKKKVALTRYYKYSVYISADPSPFSRGRRKEWRRRRVGLLVVDVLLIPCALSWRRSGVWLCRIHCQEAAALGLFGVGCVTFSVYVGGLVSSLLGVPKLHFGTLRRTDFGTLRRMVFCFVWDRI